MNSEELANARTSLDLSPVQMSRALGIPYDTFKDWQSGRRTMPSVADRCIELLLMYPRTAKKLSRK